MNRLHLRILFILIGVASFLFSPIPRTHAAETRDVLVHASHQTYWIARIEPIDQSPRVQTTIQSRTIGDSPHWKQIAQISQRAVSLTTYGTQLAVLLENGDWMTVWDGGSAPGTLPEDGSKLLMLAATEDQGTLWAIASSGGGRQPTTAGATQPAFVMPSNSRLLYRLEAGRWKLLGALPSEAAGIENFSLSSGASPILATMNDAGAVRMFAWNSSEHAWSAVGAFSTQDQFSQIRLLDGLNRETLWLADENGSGELRTRGVAGDAAWSQRTALALPADAPKGVGNDITIAGGNIRVVLINAEGKLLEYAFSPDGQGPVKSLLTPATVLPDPRAIEWTSAFATAVLMIVLVSTMRRRSEGIPAEAIEAAGLKLASFGLRLLAGGIDALPVIGTQIMIAIRLGAENANGAETLQSAQYARYVALAFYLLYTLVSEWLWGWTIGKKLCGLRVATFKGDRPNLQAIVLRNLLRIVDVAMYFLPVLLIFVSPLRQRAGDIAAETIVIKDEPKK